MLGLNMSVECGIKPGRTEWPTPNSAISRMMNMKTQGTWFYKSFALQCITSTACMIGLGSMAVGQGVAPSANGYGTRPASPTNRPAGTNQQPLGPQAGGNPAGRPNQIQGQVPGGAQGQVPLQGQGQPKGQAPGNPGLGAGNPAMNNQQALNPAFNQRPVGNQIPSGGSGNEIVTENPWKENPPTPEAEAYLDQILKHWENSTADIQRYSCLFTRWQYNSTDNFVDELAKKVGRDIRTVHVSASSGELKYMAPDKGMFKIDMLLKLSGVLDAKNQPEYKAFENSFGEWWLCDGEKVYEYDRSAKQCTRYTMPPELKGAGILESPMPFMFGVKAEKVRARYWVRALAPVKDEQGKELLVIEAYPKLQSDAVNYDHVQIYLDRELSLPARLVKFNTEHLDKPGEILKDSREIFYFRDPAIQGSKRNMLQKFTEVFAKSFIPFDIPSDWKVEDRVFAPPGVDNVRAASNPGVPQPNGAPNSPNNMRK